MALARWSSAALAALLVVASVPAPAQQKRPITVHDLLAMVRVSDPALSPDGSRVAFVATRHSAAENSVTSNIHLLDLRSGRTVELTRGTRGNNQPVWLDDRTVAFVSTRDGDPQLWTIAADGGEARKVSSVSTGVSGIVASKDGSQVLFASEVYPDCATDDCNRQRAEAEQRQKSKAKVFDRLPYRVWNSWKDGKRSHLLMMSADGSGLRDMTPGDHDVPPIDLGGYWDYAFSPDGREIAYAMNVDRQIATSTNNDIWVRNVAGGDARRISTSPGVDAQPTYSPDGRTIAFVSMDRAGFEADRRVLTLYDRGSGSLTHVSREIDLSIGEIVWAPDSRSVYVTAAWRGANAIYRIDLRTRALTALLVTGYNRSLRLTPDGRRLIFVRERMHEPAELYQMAVDGSGLRRLTTVNESTLATLDLPAAESFWFAGANGDSVHALVLKPPAFDGSRRYPMTYLIHGGPQGQWADQFHYRWSAQMFASRGHVVVMVNPRGSTAYGQAFTDAISRDWGGLVYEDLMKGVDATLARYPFIDRDRIAAAGASYGGYMVNWIAGNTDRFACLVNHDGVFNPWSMYGTTEELWFPEWEFGGTPYQNPDLYDRWSPLRLAKNFRTPMLVVHGQQDFRVDVSEGFQVFTALQRQGVPSKMLYFPDEGHWVMRPANAVVWYSTVLDWIDAYTNPKR